MWVSEGSATALLTVRPLSLEDCTICIQNFTFSVSLAVHPVSRIAIVVHVHIVEKATAFVRCGGLRMFFAVTWIPRVREQLLPTGLIPRAHSIHMLIQLFPSQCPFVLHFDLLSNDLVVASFQEVARDILAAVDASIVLHKAVLGHLLLDRRVVCIGVEHDQREGQDECPVLTLKHTRVRRGQIVALGERFHHAVDALGLSRQTELAQEQAQRRDKADTLEREAIHKRGQELSGVRIGACQELPDQPLVKHVVVIEEGSQLHKVIVRRSKRRAVTAFRWVIAATTGLGEVDFLCGLPLLRRASLDSLVALRRVAILILRAV
mmetsp:Transcript_13377/g.40393  ORF Transcript_13377/g.40393 Transcript_13377/m.40393 type:complete len:321 (+) Transcript_13377:838-1800(+)